MTKMKTHKQKFLVIRDEEDIVRLRDVLDKVKPFLFLLDLTPKHHTTIKRLIVNIDKKFGEKNG